MSERAERSRLREARRQRRHTMAQAFLPRPATPTNQFLQQGTTPRVDNSNNPPSLYNTPSSSPQRTVRSVRPGATTESLTYLLQDVWLVDPTDSILAKALANMGIETFVGLLSLTSGEVDAMQYPVEQAADEHGNAMPDEYRPVPRELKAIVKGFLGFVYYRQAILRQPLDLYNCMELTADEFHTYRCSAHFGIYNNSPDGQPVIPSPIQDTTTSSYSRTPAQEFVRSIKIDPTYYPTLSKDSGFDQFDRSLTAMARSHGMLNVLDPTYIPTTPNDIELFEKHQAFMYNVFTTKLNTTKGKELVRKYQTDFDAQSIWEDLLEYYRDSEKADGDKTELLNFIMTH